MLARALYRIRIIYYNCRCGWRLVKRQAQAGRQSMQTIRAFVAIQLPKEVKRALAEVSRMLADQVPTGAVRWVKPERMHLTLRFLGETAVDKLPALAAGLDHIGPRHEGFSLHLNQLDCFPNSRRPRVLWVGIEGDVGRLQALKRDIDATLVPLGWAADNRPFRAHLTLGRVRDSRSLRDLDWSAQVEQISLPVSTIHLIESQLYPSGPVYTVRHSSVLA
jgi:2'-5' RNA ligase